MSKVNNWFPAQHSCGQSVISCFREQVLFYVKNSQSQTSKFAWLLPYWPHVPSSVGSPQPSALSTVPPSRTARLEKAKYSLLYSILYSNVFSFVLSTLQPASLVVSQWNKIRFLGAGSFCQGYCFSCRVRVRVRALTADAIVLYALCPRLGLNLCPLSSGVSGDGWVGE